jgi:glycosyltransferase involved in cell wall biosynthesis
MRILHLIPHASAGGAERQLSHLAPEMVKLGHEIHIAYLHDGPDNVAFPGVTMHRLVVSGHHDPMLFLKVRRLIRAIQPHIIQSWILMMDVAAGLVSLTTDIVWVLREPTSEAAYQSEGLKQRLRARLVHRASAIVCNSLGGQSYWLRQDIPEGRLLVIPNAVPVDQVRDVEAIRDEKENRRRLIYAGRLIPSKNVHVLISAMTEVIRRQEVVLYIAGEGPSKSDLMELARNLDLQESVKFLGFLQYRDLWAHMKSADAFISLSSFEGMPNCICEAVACLTPVILSDIPAHRAFLDDDSALLVPMDSVAEVGNAISRTLDDSPGAGQRAARALEAVRGWTAEGIAVRYLDLYSKLLADKGLQART